MDDSDSTGPRISPGKDNSIGSGIPREKGRMKKEEGRSKKEEGRGKRVREEQLWRAGGANLGGGGK